jgi:hypothetical protein
MIRKLAAVVLGVLVSAGCGTTSPVVFSGKDIGYARGLGIAGRKEQDRVLVVSGEYDFGISLPYAEDWTFDPSPGTPVFGSSRTADMVASVQVGRPGRKVEEEAYLRDELMKNVMKTSESRGIKVQGAEVRKIGEHPVLEYEVEMPVESGVFRQTHWWGVRQNPAGLVCDLHLSTTCTEKSKRDNLRVAAHSIIGQEFHFIPGSN